MTQPHPAEPTAIRRKSRLRTGRSAPPHPSHPHAPSNHRPSRLPSFQRHGPPPPSDVIRHAVRFQARHGHAPGRWRCPMAVVLRCGAMSSLVSEQGALQSTYHCRLGLHRLPSRSASIRAQQGSRQIDCMDRRYPRRPQVELPAVLQDTHARQGRRVAQRHTQICRAV
jgi:hypothetical protein